MGCLQSQVNYVQLQAGGETMMQQQTNRYYENRYKFTGKELDEKTGLYDFGARHYNPSWGVWLSVDPLASKYPSISPYVYCADNPVNRVDLDGALDYPIYGKDGSYLGDDGRTGGDLAFIGERDGNGGFKNLTQFTDNHTQFQTISAIVKHEAGTSNENENLWIAHTANNAANESGKSLYSKLMTDFSSVSTKNSLSITNSSKTANAARAGVIDVMLGGTDPTGGATLWDGTDILAWGLNSPNGTPQNKFEEYKSLSISGGIYNSFLNNTLSKYSKGKVRYDGKYYNIPSSVFTNKSNWSNGNFFFNTGLKEPPSYGIEATGTVGHSIFWKKVK